MEELIDKQTIATGHIHGARRFAFLFAYDQHDFAKVNSRIRSVKNIFYEPHK